MRGRLLRRPGNFERRWRGKARASPWLMLDEDLRSGLVEEQESEELLSWLDDSQKPD